MNEIQHAPSDMTATVAGTVTLAELQAHLGRNGQWLAIDPPAPERWTVRDILAHDASGPRRFGCGTIRDYTIGMKVELADGRVVSPGGKVVKNVAGYDLQKLFIGARHTLGKILEATFKLRPVPEREQFAQKECASLSEAGAAIETIVDSPLAPVVLDLRAPAIVVLGFAGTGEDVAWQMEQARGLGFAGPADLKYDGEFRAGGDVRKISVLPSRLMEAVAALGGAPFVARAGNGVIYCRAGAAAPAAELPLRLFQRVKETFDPRGVLPRLPL